jgi:hypothetical protein
MFRAISAHGGGATISGRWSLSRNGPQQGRIEIMKKLIGTVFALALALVSMLPAAAAAKLSANRNQTLLRLVTASAVIAALVSSLPGMAAAKLAANHNQATLRG